MKISNLTSFPISIIFRLCQSESSSLSSIPFHCSRSHVKWNSSLRILCSHRWSIHIIVSCNMHEEEFELNNSKFMISWEFLSLFIFTFLRISPSSLRKHCSLLEVVTARYHYYYSRRRNKMRRNFFICKMTRMRDLLRIYVCRGSWEIESIKMR